MRRYFKFYVLWPDQTWTTEGVWVRGDVAVHELAAQHEGRRLLADKHRNWITAVGPVYYTSDLYPDEEGVDAT